MENCTSPRDGTSLRYCHGKARQSVPRAQGEGFASAVWDTPALGVMDNQVLTLLKFNLSVYYISVMYWGFSYHGGFTFQGGLTQAPMMPRDACLSGGCTPYPL